MTDIFAEIYFLEDQPTQSMLVIKNINYISCCKCKHKSTKYCLGKEYCNFISHKNCIIFFSNIGKIMKSINKAPYEDLIETKALWKSYASFHCDSEINRIKSFWGYSYFNSQKQNNKIYAILCRTRNSILPILKKAQQYDTL